MAQRRTTTRRRTRTPVNVNHTALKRLQDMEERNPLEDFLARMLVAVDGGRLPVFRVGEAMAAFNIDYSRGGKTSQMLQALGFRNLKLARSRKREEVTYPCLIGIDFVTFGNSVDMEMMDMADEDAD